MSSSPHRSTSLAARMGHWSANHRKAAILGWLAFVVVAILAGQLVSQQTLTQAELTSGEAGRAEQALDDAGLRPTSEVVLVQSKTLTTEDAEFRATINDVTTRLSSTAHVEKLTSPLSGGGSVSADRHSALVDFEIAGTDEETADRVDPTLAAVAAVQDRHPGFVVEQFGSASADKDIDTVIQDDLAKAGMLSIPVTLLILMIALGSIVAAGIPLLLGISAVLATMGLIAIPSQIFPLDDNVSAVILLIGLAVGVDYSFFYLRREREERAAGRSPRDALDIAAATSGRAVLISGLTVIVAMAGMLISGEKGFISIAEGAIMVVLIAMFASLTVLPAVLAWLGDRVEKGRIPLVGRKRRQCEQSRFWSAIVDRVMRRPWLSIVLAGGALVLLAVPALNLKTVNTDIEQLPEGIGIIDTYDRVRAAFPSEGVAAVVAVEAEDVRSGEAAAGISLLQRRAESSDRVLKGGEVNYSEDGTIAEVVIPTVGNGTDARSTAALNEIRDELIPATLGGIEGVTVNVSGNAAQSEDFRDQLTSRLPLIFGFVFALTFVLMLVTFRSIVIPIKAILLNLLSVGAAYGALVLVFQNGNGESLLGFTSNGGVTSWLPLFLFVILFGLSMDYHVFILSRVREAYQRGMDTSEAVRFGITQTAGTVTSAALVMVAVFSVFMTLDFVDFKQMGFGLAVAVLIDATIIRGVLLPASMKVLGDWNWYLPKWLEWMPRVGSDGAPHLPDEPGDSGPPDDGTGVPRAPKPEPVPA